MCSQYWILGLYSKLYWLFEMDWLGAILWVEHVSFIQILMLLARTEWKLLEWEFPNDTRGWKLALCNMPCYNEAALLEYNKKTVFLV